MLSLNKLGLAMMLCLSGCPWSNDSSSEAHHPTYAAFEKQQPYLAEFLPKGAANITHFSVLDFDTNYHYVEADVQIKDFQQLSLNSAYADSTVYFNVAYSDGQFNRCFYKKPSWWNQETLLNYQTNFVRLFNTANDYGRGCWAFYDSEGGKIRFFMWSQQWLSEKDFKNVFQLE